MRIIVSVIKLESIKIREDITRAYITGYNETKEEE